MKFVGRKRSLTPGRLCYCPFEGGGPDVVLILCRFVVYTTMFFMYSLALHFVLAFLQSF